jgi:dynein heavy chain
LDIFTKYNALWARDRDEELKEFLANDPRVSEFEAKIRFYENLSTDINSQSEFIPVGPLAIFTGRFNCFNKTFIILFFRTFKICS